ncbi:Ppx/GppA phosphatase family protein [Helicobacter sp. 23-1044]
MSKITAVIDIGSNSARMAIFKRTSRFGFHLIYEVKSKVRISENCYENGGILQEVPMERAINTICDFVGIAKNYKARKILCVATSATRDAPNRAEFLNRVKRKTGVRIKVIDGQKEAFFGGVACANLLHKKDGITIDIGGGSTECAIIKDGKLQNLISLNIGTIRLKELFSGAKIDIKKAKKFIQTEFEKISFDFKNECVFGIGGTIRALSKMIMKKEKYPINTIHGYEFEVQKYSDFFKEIYTSDIKGLRALQVPQDREDNIREGALILSMLLEKFGAKSVITSGVGVREGVFLSDLLRNSRFLFPNGFNPSYRSLIDRFCINERAQGAVKKNATLLFNLLAPKHKIPPKYLFHLENAAGLNKIGDSLGFYSMYNHSAYFILNALNYGYSHIDRAIISLLVKYSDKRIPKDDEILYISKLMPPIAILQWLSFVLSVAEVASLSPKGVAFEFSDDTLRVKSDFYLLKEKILALNLPDSTLKIAFE